MNRKPARVKWRVESVVEAIVLLSKLVDKDDERIDAAHKRNDGNQGPVDRTADWATRSDRSLARVDFRIAALEEAKIRTEEALARMTEAHADTNQRLNELTALFRGRGNSGDGH